MGIETKIIELEKTNDYSTEYIESKLIEQNIIPLRWSIVKISEKYISVNVSYEA